MIKADAIYPVQVTCPSCGETETVKVSLAARLETTKDDCLLGVKARAGKADHMCGQTSIEVPDEQWMLTDKGLEAIQ